jgi:hypothetical protein
MRPAMHICQDRLAVGAFSCLQLSFPLCDLTPTPRTPLWQRERDTERYPPISQGVLFSYLILGELGDVYVMTLGKSAAGRREHG